MQRSHIEAAMTIKAEIVHLKFQRNSQVTKTEGEDKSNYQINRRHCYEWRILAKEIIRETE